MNGGNDSNYKTITEDVLRVKGFRLTVDFEVKAIKVQASALYPNINSATVFVVPIVSKTHIKVFFSFSFYKTKAWSDQVLETSPKWLTETVGLKDTKGHTALSEKIMTEFSEFIYTPIAEKFNLNLTAEKGQDLA